MTNLNKIIDSYLKKKEFKFRNGKLFNNQNKILFDTSTSNKSKNYTLKETNISL
jgi:hypothetical protein